MIRPSIRPAVCLLLWLASTIACWAGEPAEHRPGKVIPLLGEGQQNLVPNASFECGTDGWREADGGRSLGRGR
jgi:hypothetical protein